MYYEQLIVITLLNKFSELYADNAHSIRNRKPCKPSPYLLSVLVKLYYIITTIYGSKVHVTELKIHVCRLLQ
jgi:hypothetical protein